VGAAIGSGDREDPGGIIAQGIDLKIDGVVGAKVVGAAGEVCILAHLIREVNYLA